MVTNDRIEEYLFNGDYPYELIGEGVWLVQDVEDHIDNIVIAHTPPVLTFRVKFASLANVEEKERLFHHLLKLNSTMVAGAYGIEGDNIVITDSLQSENLDSNEFFASIEGITYSLREHFEGLRAFVSTDVLLPGDETKEEE